MPGFLQDLRYGARGLRRNPGFALAAVVAAALGIGASTAGFSAVDRILFRPLPYAGEDRLVSVGIMTPLDNNEFLFADGYLDLRRHPAPFESVTSFEAGAAACDLTEEKPLRLWCVRAEANFLPVLGLAPAAGRSFTAEEDRPNAPRVAMISYQLWRSRFGNDPSVIGKTASLDGAPVRIIGVLNKDFELPTLDNADVLVPEAIDRESQRGPGPGRVRWAFARLKPDVTIEQATA